MILYDPRRRSGLTEFGIDIPLLDSRAVKTFNHLATHRVLGRSIARWHVSHIDAAITRADLLRVHSADYVERLYSDGLETEILKTYELVDDQGRYHRYRPKGAERPLGALFERALATAAGTYQCCRLALDSGFCYYFGGGTHHARYDTGSGFCLINDIVIALRRLQAERRIRNAWVIDVDAHKGDGTAALTRDDPSLRTLSIHMAQGWPLEGPRYDAQGNLNPAFVPSDVDIPVAAGENEAYVERLERGLEQLARDPSPDLAVVVDGVDPYEGDALPSTQELKLTLNQLFERDRLIYEFLMERGIPQAYLMAGGYGEHSWKAYARFLEWALLARFGTPGNKTQ